LYFALGPPISADGPGSQHVVLFLSSLAVQRFVKSDMPQCQSLKGGQLPCPLPCSVSSSGRLVADQRGEEGATTTSAPHTGIAPDVRRNRCRGLSASAPRILFEERDAIFAPWSGRGTGDRWIWHTAGRRSGRSRKLTRALSASDG
jgi:hypothetical protein